MIHHYTKGNSNSDSDKHIHEIIAMLSVVVVVVVFILTGINLWLPWLWPPLWVSPISQNGITIIIACMSKRVCVFACCACSYRMSFLRMPIPGSISTYTACNPNTYLQYCIFIYKCIPTYCADTCAQDSWLPSCFNWRFPFSSNWSLSWGASPIYQARFVDRGKISELVRNYGVV